MHSQPRLVLASSSPRRRQLLEMSGFSFRVHVGTFQEPTPPTLTSPHQFAKSLAQKKAKASQESDPRRSANTIYLAADTIVVLGNRLYGKPKNHTHAKKILSSLSGKNHSVITGWVLLRSDGAILGEGTSRSSVHWKKIQKTTLTRAARHPESQDKAGAYAFQGLSLLWTKLVSGSPSNIIGLPLEQVVDALLRAGVRQWTLKTSKKIT